MALTSIRRAGRHESSISVGTSILYGIFVSEKSYLIGKRCLEKREHVDMVVGKAVTGRSLPYLPKELVDMIAGHLYASEEAMVRAARKADKPCKENRMRFTRNDKLKLLPNQRTTLDRIVSCPSCMICRPSTDVPKFDLSGIAMTRVASTKAGSPQVREPECHYIHLSISKERPTISMSLPAGSVWQKGKHPHHCVTAITYPMTDGVVEGTCSTTRENSWDIAYYKPKPSKTADEDAQNKRQPKQINRLLQVDYVEDAIQSWDPDVIKKFVDLLELHPIPVEDSDPLMPTLHICQGVREV